MGVGVLVWTAHLAAAPLPVPWVILKAEEMASECACMCVLAACTFTPPSLTQVYSGPEAPTPGAEVSPPPI